ncbi:hypothetical protein [Kitasatospora sp. NPDC091207]|uniref:hypothetical protein n=1 Tax=Kitasatospora sp. NPDC091207 TaxID=3364083 RepID=UPI003820A916
MTKRYDQDQDLVLQRALRDARHRQDIADRAREAAHQDGSAILDVLDLETDDDQAEHYREGEYDGGEPDDHRDRDDQDPEALFVGATRRSLLSSPSPGWPDHLAAPAPSSHRRVAPGQGSSGAGDGARGRR